MTRKFVNSQGTNLTNNNALYQKGDFKRNWTLSAFAPVSWMLISNSHDQFLEFLLVTSISCHKTLEQVLANRKKRTAVYCNWNQVGLYDYKFILQIPVMFGTNINHILFWRRITASFSGCLQVSCKHLRWRALQQ